MFFTTHLSNIFRLLLSASLLTLLVLVCMNFNSLIQLATSNPNSPDTHNTTLFFAEFGWNEDLIYEVSSSDPNKKKVIHTVEHSPGFGLNPAINTHKGNIAYVVLSKDAVPSRQSSAELWIFNTHTQEATRLARDADISARPVLRKDGHSIIYRSSKNIDGSLRMTFRCHHSFAGLVAKKGSICLDGVSLTVNEVSDGFKYFDFEVNCIPHTLRVTTLSNLTIGDHVHIEFDQIARYIDRLIRLKEK